MILDDGGDATMFALWGARVEAGEKLFEPSNAEEIEFVRALTAPSRSSAALTARRRRPAGHARQDCPSSAKRMSSAMEAAGERAPPEPANSRHC